jgi:hypothetical protein
LTGGFQLIQYERYANAVTFSSEALVDYLSTQSNVIVAVEGGREKIGEARRWLTESTECFFKSSREVEFLFSGPIAYVRPAARTL